ncbi:MAG TPA: ribonuclease P protein component, partial [Thiotrichales bacterium]|nr:ribonuclease P protein component [Thiotrichales bacterium]
MTRSQGFPRQARLTRPAEFRRVFADGLRSGNRHMLVVAAPNDQGQARLGLAISRKVSPRAVVRNRLKRLIREAFRQRRARLAALDFVVVGR